ncbi:MAG: hypothetical protein EA397_10455 [Deltaproteobacteria bacterium]|nr:MAG: hypothetical protein EA397_10455 [Deltaproteobacteria bacterium]
MIGGVDRLLAVGVGDGELAFTHDLGRTSDQVDAVALEQHLHADRQLIGDRRLLDLHRGYVDADRALDLERHGGGGLDLVQALPAVIMALELSIHTANGGSQPSSPV